MRILFTLFILLSASNTLYASKILFAYDTLNYQQEAEKFSNILRHSNYEMTFFDLETDTLSNLSEFDQVFVFDLSPLSDNTSNHMFNYQKIANWYNQKQDKNIIADGRILSSLWNNTSNLISGSQPGQEIPMLINYADQMALRGGGLFLGTDHGDYRTSFYNGINSLNRLIGIDDFVGNFIVEPKLAIVDQTSPLFVESAIIDNTSYNVPANAILATSTGSATPLGIQSNGLNFKSFAISPSYSVYPTPHNTLISYAFSEPLTGTVEVPEPSTIWLFIFSLLMWFIPRRHRTKPELLSRMLKQRVTT